MAYIATVAVLTVLFPKAGGAEYMLYSIFGGGLFLGAFFMATDYATSPVTKKGQLIYGIGCGLFLSLIHIYTEPGLSRWAGAAVMSSIRTKGRTEAIVASGDRTARRKPGFACQWR